MSTATTATDDEASMGILLACVLAGVATAVVAFVMTADFLLAMGAYIVTACFSYALTWVIQ